MPTLMQDRIWGDKDGGRSHPRVFKEDITFILHWFLHVVYTDRMQ